ncbi:Methyltransferase type 11 [Rippkaea orientalis PCC 8801]|uniref:Methyltransferase type 11 n=1 Tax=Rippkaea orientalis (strain PCC 8801 / RF-1) TaxID=41431 RepID=B7K310_RIPO1|nr:methyltransferase domain-containing protein [Rippkaea orientalis]ACK67711.1 Methyltransferase type 11 [Rippkaea orientalis PCC 8801]
MDNYKDYKHQVTEFFNQRQNNYDTDYSYRRGLRLVQLTPIEKGQKILDIATGTGIAAIEAAIKLDKTGQIIGVDFSPGMLTTAQRKIDKAQLKNIELIQADIDELSFPEESFDVILCSSALPWFTDIPKSLMKWHSWLKTGGIMSFSCYSETAFLTPIIVRVCGNIYNIDLPNWNEPLGTPQKCHQVLEKAGFKQIKITTEQFGAYLNLEEAKDWWKGESTWINPRGNPLQLLSDKQLQTLKKAYDKEIEALATVKGVWQDITTFFVIARKSTPIGVNG